MRAARDANDLQQLYKLGNEMKDKQLQSATTKTLAEELERAIRDLERKQLESQIQQVIKE